MRLMRKNGSIKIKVIRIAEKIGIIIIRKIDIRVRIRIRTKREGTMKIKKQL